MSLANKTDSAKMLGEVAAVEVRQSLPLASLLDRHGIGSIGEVEGFPERDQIVGDGRVQSGVVHEERPELGLCGGHADDRYIPPIELRQVPCRLVAMSAFGIEKIDQEAPFSEGERPAIDRDVSWRLHQLIAFAH